MVCTETDTVHLAFMQYTCICKNINISLYNTVNIIYLLFYMGVKFSLSQTGNNLHWGVSEQNAENNRV